MRNSKRNGFIKSLTTVIAVVLMLALMLTGCTDKDAQSLANKAQSAADKAQTDANTANNNANGAQQDATNALAGLEDLKATVDTLPTDEAVAAAILDTLNKYVKGEESKLTDESIITYEELVNFLTSEEMTTLLGKYATLAYVEEKITGVNTSVSNLDAKVTETLKGYYTKAEIDALKAELNTAIKAATDAAAKNTTDLGAVANRVTALETQVAGALNTFATKAELNAFQSGIEATLATYVTSAALQTAKNELNAKINQLNNRLFGNDNEDPPTVGVITTIQNSVTALNTTLANLSTAVEDHKTAYNAKMSAIDGLLENANDAIEDLQNDVTTNAGNITANANEILALKDRVAALETAKTAFDSQIADLEADLADLETKVVNEVEKKIAELETKFNANCDELKKLINESYTKISTLNKDYGDLKATVEANRKALDEKINYVLAEIQKLATQLEENRQDNLEAFEAATLYIAANDYKFDDLLADYAAKESQYNKDVYAAIVKAINENRIKFRRALTAEAAEEILENVTGDAAAEMNLAQALYTAIQNVYRVEGYLVIGAYTEVNGAMVLTDAKTSVADVVTCENILAEALAQLSAEDYANYINMYDPGEGDFVNLETAVKDLRATITALEAIEDKVVADVHPAILAITGSATKDYFANAYNDVKLDMFDEIELLDTQVKAATLVIQQFKDANFDDAKNVNIARLIGSQARIEAANARLTAIETLKVEAAAMADEMAELIAEYDADGTGTYYLYTGFKPIVAYMEAELMPFIEANFAEPGISDIMYYIDTTIEFFEAGSYTEYILTTYAETSKPVIAAMDAVIKTGNVYSEKNYEAMKDAVRDLSRWVKGGSINIEDRVDEYNYVLILGEKRINDFFAVRDALEALNTAAANVDAINAKIAALVEMMNKNEINIFTMKDYIRPLRNEIVAWMNAGAIVAPEVTEENAVLVEWITKTLATENEFDTVQYTVTGTYVAENWALLDSADFIAVINAFDALVKRIVDAAYVEGGVIDTIDAIVANDGYILYQTKAIENSWSKFNAWTGEYFVGVSDFAKFDLGENYKEERDLIVEHSQTLAKAQKLYEETLEAAQNEYAGFKADLTTALTDEYKVGIMASKIPASYDAVMEWVGEYIDETRGFNDTIKALKNILTEAEVEAIETKYEAYEDLVEEAIETYTAFKTLLDQIELGKYNVYMGTNIQSIVIGGTPNLFTTYAFNVLGTMAKYGVSGTQNELVTTFGSDDMDTRFNTDVEGGINMVTVLTKAFNLYGGAENELSYLYYINALRAEADEIIEAYANVFTESYVYTIYSRKNIAAIRAAYDAWCVKAGMENTLAAYDVAGMAAYIGEYKALLEDILASEAEIAALEAEKIAETNALKDLIAGLDAIGGANKVTWLNAQQIKTAYTAYTAWVLGTDDFTAIFPVNFVYAIQGKPWEQPIEGYNVSEAEIAKLDAYYDVYLVLVGLIENVEKAVDKFEDGVTAEELKNAQDAVQALKDAQDGKLNGALEAATVIAIAEAEMTLELNKALAEIDAITGLSAEYVANLKAEVNAFFNGMTADMKVNEELKALFNGTEPGAGNDNVYDGLVLQLKAQYVEYIEAAKAEAAKTTTP